MNSQGTDLTRASTDLLNAAVSVSRAATAPGASTGLQPALMRIEDSLRVLSTAVHDCAADAAPRFRPRYGPGGSVISTSADSALGQLSRGQEAKLATVILEASTALAACAHAVGASHSSLTPLLRGEAAASKPREVPGERGSNQRTHRHEDDQRVVATAGAGARG